MVNEGITFTGKKVTLGGDVVVEKNITDKSIQQMTPEERLNLRKWTPIGTMDKPFAGTFDGNAKKIEGIYVTSDNSGIGLFGATKEGT